MEQIVAQLINQGNQNLVHLIKENDEVMLDENKKMISIIEETFCRMLDQVLMERNEELE
jgi:hypothetical protein